MSDAGDRDEAPAATGAMDINTAVHEVLKTAVVHDGLSRGFHEATKTLYKREAVLCVLVNDCDEKMYVNLIEALVLKITSTYLRLMTTRNWVNGLVFAKLTKRDNQECSCVVVKNWGKESQALDIVNVYFAAKRGT